MNVLCIYLFIYLFALFPQVKAPRPTENWSATHFWVRTHQLRNTDLKHIPLFTSPFHTPLITCLHFDKVGGGAESRMAAASQPSLAPGSISSLAQPKPCTDHLGLYLFLLFQPARQHHLSSIVTLPTGICSPPPNGDEAAWRPWAVLSLEDSSR